MKVLDLAVVGRGRFDDALLIVADLRNHGGVCTHTHDHDSSSC
jgi:hypothetical protein